jgi:hypothetical protein
MRLGWVRYYLLTEKSWGSAKFFEDILGSAPSKRLKNTGLLNTLVNRF